MEYFIKHNFLQEDKAAQFFYDPAALEKSAKKDKGGGKKRHGQSQDGEGPQQKRPGRDARETSYCKANILVSTVIQLHP